jgi:hypothetical protein
VRRWWPAATPRPVSRPSRSACSSIPSGKLLMLLSLASSSSTCGAAGGNAPRPGSTHSRSASAAHPLRRC